jgi:hypothetical protein
MFGEPTYADAILDRIVHNAHQINLTGHSHAPSSHPRIDHSAVECQKLSASEAPDPGRHHVGTPGDIISECPGDFVGIRNLILWSCDGTLDRIHHALYVECREQDEREASPTAAIIDSQSVKSAEKGAVHRSAWL